MLIHLLHWSPISGATYNFTGSPTKWPSEKFTDLPYKTVDHCASGNSFLDDSFKYLLIDLNFGLVCFDSKHHYTYSFICAELLSKPSRKLLHQLTRCPQLWFPMQASPAAGTPPNFCVVLTLCCCILSLSAWPLCGATLQSTYQTQTQ